MSGLWLNSMINQNDSTISSEPTATTKYLHILSHGASEGAAVQNGQTDLPDFSCQKMCDSIPLLSFPLLSHCTIHLSPLHYFSTHLQIDNKIILPSSSGKSFSCSSNYVHSLLSYWLKLNTKFLQNHSEVAVPLSRSEAEWWKQDIPAPHDTQ